MTGWRFALVTVALTALTAGVGWQVGHRRQSAPPVAAAPAASRGLLLYQTHCASCHGGEGKGDGVAAAELRPRDFAARPWRSAISADSIRRVTRDGLPGTAMPAFAAALSDADLDAIAAHVLELATRRPPVEHVADEGERLLRGVGFTDLRGIAPPPLRLSTAAGAAIKLSDLRGQLVVLHFWGTGCAPCLQEMPSLDALAKSHAGRLVVLHICADEDDSAVAQKVLHRAIPGAVNHCESAGLGLAAFEVNALPAVWLIDPTGHALGRATGARDWQSPAMAKLIAHFLSASPRH